MARLQCSAVFSTSSVAPFAPPWSGLTLCSSVQTIGSRDCDTLSRRTVGSPSIHSPHSLSSAKCSTCVSLGAATSCCPPMGFRAQSKLQFWSTWTRSHHLDAAQDLLPRSLVQSFAFLFSCTRCGHTKVKLQFISLYQHILPLTLTLTLKSGDWEERLISLSIFPV